MSNGDVVVVGSYPTRDQAVRVADVLLDSDIAATFARSFSVLGIWDVVVLAVDAERARAVLASIQDT